MGRFRAFAVALVLLYPVVSAGAGERPCGSREPIASVFELGPVLYSCWKPPPGTENLEITLRFALRRDGSMIGNPRASYAKLGQDMPLKRAFVASVLEALYQNLPLPITDDFGGAIAGRPITLLFSTAAESTTADAAL
ncbi:TonB C-terminal domain-containing protein [Phyllobacterium lublinensis]|uniref:TonB C-terminal domain-containing protein n=1 Tax=Phyllobacterium lublinensis TaxID=2875708 RepID=UPI001CCA2649|nr:TonB C-terminal domain-containing protein [Phyllobacterium sp. 2063]MBZ9654916.1 TonB C-terminal domain-containing protein [Phyllobacterium sp. 2063]